MLLLRPTRIALWSCLRSSPIRSLKLPAQVLKRLLLVVTKLLVAIAAEQLVTVIVLRFRPVESVVLE